MKLILNEIGGTYMYKMWEVTTLNQQDEQCLHCVMAETDNQAKDIVMKNYPDSKILNVQQYGSYTQSLKNIQAECMAI